MALSNRQIGFDELEVLDARPTSRIEHSTDELRTSEDLAAFAASRANDLLLTQPRLAKLDDFDDDFERLFAQLVEQPPTVHEVGQTVQ